MKMILGLLVSAACLAIIGCDSPRGSQNERATVAVAKDAVVIDVRTPEEFKQDHVAGAINIPVDTIQTRIEEVVPSKSTPVAVHCQSGRRAQIATDILEAKGYRVQNLGSLANAKAVLNK